MDQMFHKTLRFDRFTLDMTRGFLREGDRDIDLRPKAFQVLCQLAANAGRLVPKQELFEAVWPAVIVSDDSLVQCIRELRNKMGDDTHLLIRTVHRRGYLLDAEVTGQTPQAFGGRSASPMSPPRAVSANLYEPRPASPCSFMIQKRYLPLAAAALVTAVLGIASVNILSPLTRNGSMRVDVIETAPAPHSHALLTADDTRRIRELAFQKQLPLPDFDIERTGGDVRDADRRFVGIWMSETGWLGSFRQMMLIVTSVDADGRAEGYAANGPPQTKSQIQSPPSYWPLKMQIFGDSISFRDTNGQFEGTLTPQNKIALKLTYSDRVKTGWVLLEPVWTLVGATRAKWTETAVR